MTRITTGMVQRNILSDLNKVSEKLSHTQSKVASNREITRPSDDPFNASRAMSLRGSLEQTRQHTRNVDDAQGWQDATDSALTRMTGVVQRARELVLAASNDALDGSAREAAAQEIDQLADALKQYGNSSYRGAYLFAGTDLDEPPYQMGADDTYAGNPDRVTREIGPDVLMDINVTGHEALGAGAPAGGALRVLRTLSEDLRAGDAAALRGADLQDLDASLEHLLELQAANGARSNRLETALGRLAEVEESTLSQLSQTEDVDIAKTLIDLSSQQAAYQAALRAGATIVQTSLLDFLR